MKRLISVFILASIFISCHSIGKENNPPFISVSPAISLQPEIHNSEYYGVYPDTPFLYQIPATGSKPLKYSTKKLPTGLILDSNSGIISGTIETRGIYPVTLIVSNDLGKSESKVTIQVGDKLALTPPLGWNSWNSFEHGVNEAVILGIIDAFVHSGLRDLGYEYVVIDDCWAEKKRKNGHLVINQIKFPSGIKFLADYAHSKGMKLGIYSDAAEMTCAGVQPGSYGYESVDIADFAKWGIDYVKYDYCHAPEDQNTAIQRYTVFGDELESCGRSVLYSICEWGLRDPWLWAKEAGGHLWRTTYDMRDNWEFNKKVNRYDEFWVGVADAIDLQVGLESWNGPGGWNDPDMMVIGADLAGSSGHGHSKGLNHIQERTMFSFWAMFSAPIMHNNDLRRLDPFCELYDASWAEKIMDIIANPEILSIHRDSLGNQAKRLHQSGNIEIWIKTLSDGDFALGVFNRGDEDEDYLLNWVSLGLGFPRGIRDLWRGQDISVYKEGQVVSLKAYQTLILRVDM